MKLKRSDIIIPAALLLLGAASAIVIALLPFEHGAYVTVSVNGDEYGSYSLFEDRTVEIKTPDGINVLVIEGGAARISEADCSNKICVAHAPISKTGETVVCLPHGMIAEVRR